MGPELQRQWLNSPGVASVDFRKAMPLLLSPDRPAVTIMVRGVDRGDRAFGAAPRWRMTMKCQQCEKQAVRQLRFGTAILHY